jgi:hypothetical protein
LKGINSIEERASALREKVKQIEIGIKQSISGYLMGNPPGEALRVGILENPKIALLFCQYYHAINDLLKVSRPKRYGLSKKDKIAYINEQIKKIRTDASIELKGKHLSSTHNSAIKVIADLWGLSYNTIDNRLFDAKRQVKHLHKSFNLSIPIKEFEKNGFTIQNENWYSEQYLYGMANLFKMVKENLVDKLKRSDNANSQKTISGHINFLSALIEHYEKIAVELCKIGDPKVKEQTIKFLETNLNQKLLETINILIAK